MKKRIETTSFATDAQLSHEYKGCGFYKFGVEVEDLNLHLEDVLFYPEQNPQVKDDDGAIRAIREVCYGGNVVAWLCPPGAVTKDYDWLYSDDLYSDNETDKPESFETLIDGKWHMWVGPNSEWQFYDDEVGAHQAAANVVVGLISDYIDQALFDYEQGW